MQIKVTDEGKEVFYIDTGERGTGRTTRLVHQIADWLDAGGLTFTVLCASQSDIERISSHVTDLVRYSKSKPTKINRGSSIVLEHNLSKAVLSTGLRPVIEGTSIWADHYYTENELRRLLCMMLEIDERTVR